MSANILSTTRTSLTRLVWNYLYGLDIALGGFLFDKGEELRKTLGMEAAGGLRDLLTAVSCYTTILEVLKDQHASGWHVLDDVSDKHMGVGVSLPHPFARRFLQVPFGRCGSPGLQLTFEAKYPALLCFPTRITPKHAGAHHRRVSLPHVSAAHIGGRGEGVSSAYRYISMHVGSLFPRTIRRNSCFLRALKDRGIRRSQEP